MTYQRDPEHVRTAPLTPEEIARREDNALRDTDIVRRDAEAARGSGLTAIVIALVAILGVGYLAYAMLSPRSLPDAPRATEFSTPRTATPAPTPAAPVIPQTR